MIAVLIHLVIILLILGLVWWAVTAIIGVIPLPAPVKTIVNVLLIVILCLVLIYTLAPLAGSFGPVRL